MLAWLRTRLQSRSSTSANNHNMTAPTRHGLWHAQALDFSLCFDELDESYVEVRALALKQEWSLGDGLRVGFAQSQTDFNLICHQVTECVPCVRVLCGVVSSLTFVSFHSFRPDPYHWMHKVVSRM